MYKKIIATILIMVGLATAALLAGQSKPNPKINEPNKILVTTSFYPLAYFAEQVGGERVHVQSITQNGTEPHDFEPTPQDIITLRSSQIFFYNGSGLDPWVDRAEAELIAGGVKTVNVSQAVSLNESDPHIWLDPIRARQIAELMRDTLIARDPSGADYYRTQTLVLTNRLDMLHSEYEQKLGLCTNRRIVVSHDAFNYLAARYNFIIYPIAGLSPEAEPSAKHLAELVELVKEKNIKTIFSESLVSPKFAETLAKETGAVTNVLNPIEGLTPTEVGAGKNYETIMRDNLSALTTAMLCQ